MSDESVKLPWIPGFYRPNFIFYKLKISIPTRIPSSFIYFAIFASIFYIFAGGVYDLVEDPFARGSDSEGNPILIWPDQDRQFLIEGVVAAMVMFMGAGGLYLLNQATSDPHNPSRATYMQAMGIGMIIVAFITLQSMFNQKS
ncbi:MAG: hypothetical protein ACW99A_02675 [Candidatus Kariarchaeaceae archaeon]|jgi:hypothetical protein